MESKIEQAGPVVPVEDPSSATEQQPSGDTPELEAVIPSDNNDGAIPASGDADGTNPAAEQPPQQLTEAMIRKLRAKYFTVRHQRLEGCGHKFDEINQPRFNCENCWFQWFNTHPQLVEVTDQFYRTHGAKALEAMRGTKYLKNFRRYMATVIHFMKEEGRLNESNSEGRVGSTLVPGEEVGTDGSAGTSVEGGEAESSGYSEQVSEQAIRDAVVAEAGKEETSSPAIYID